MLPSRELTYPTKQEKERHWLKYSGWEKDLLVPTRVPFFGIICYLLFYTLEHDERFEPKNNPWTWTSFEPNLHDFGFQPLIHGGVLGCRRKWMDQRWSDQWVFSPQHITSIRRWNNPFTSLLGNSHIPSPESRQFWVDDFPSLPWFLRGMFGDRSLKGFWHENQGFGPFCCSRIRHLGIALLQKQWKGAFSFSSWINGMQNKMCWVEFATLSLWRLRQMIVSCGSQSELMKHFLVQQNAQDFVCNTALLKTMWTKLANRCCWNNLPMKRIICAKFCTVLVWNTHLTHCTYQLQLLSGHCMQGSPWFIGLIDAWTHQVWKTSREPKCSKIVPSL